MESAGSRICPALADGITSGQEFDVMADSAENMADQIGYERVYIIGRPG
jgi:hypothetical protein